MLNKSEQNIMNPSFPSPPPPTWCSIHDPFHQPLPPPMGCTNTMWRVEWPLIPYIYVKEIHIVLYYSLFTVAAPWHKMRGHLTDIAYSKDVRTFCVRLIWHFVKIPLHVLLCSIESSVITIAYTITSSNKTQKS